jgi:hypothetical protein
VNEKRVARIARSLVSLWGNHRFRPGDVVKVRGERGTFTVVKRDFFGMYSLVDERGRKVMWSAGEMDMRRVAMVAAQGTSLRFTGNRIPRELSRKLGRMGLIGFDHSDKGASVSFDRKVSKREIARRLGIEDWMVDDIDAYDAVPGEYIYFLVDPEALE